MRTGQPFILTTLDDITILRLADHSDIGRKWQFRRVADQ
jgi:hypothetical protein